MQDNLGKGQRDRDREYRRLPGHTRARHQESTQLAAMRQKLIQKGRTPIVLHIRLRRTWLLAFYLVSISVCPSTVTADDLGSGSGYFTFRLSKAVSKGEGDSYRQPA